MSLTIRTPLVSIIIPVYNVEQYIYQCLDSVLGQTYNNLEIIIVNDGSSDECPRICDEYALKDSRISVIHQKNGGLSVARNAALAVARGKYIAFVDSDDSVDPHWIEHSVKVLEQNHLSAVIFAAKLMNEHGHFIGERFKVYDVYTEISGQQAFEKVITDEIGSQVWKAVYDRRCWDNVWFPDGLFYEDLFVTHKVYARMTNNVAFLPEPLYNYRLNTNGISLSLDNRGIKAYHIFLGLRTMYDFSKKRCDRKITDVCLANVSRAARNVLVYNNLTAEFLYECKQFLKSKMWNITICQKLSWKEKLKIFLEVFIPIVPDTIRLIKHKRGK